MIERRCSVIISGNVSIAIVGRDCGGVSIARSFWRGVGVIVANGAVFGGSIGCGWDDGDFRFETDGKRRRFLAFLYGRNRGFVRRRFLSILQLPSALHSLHIFLQSTPLFAPIVDVAKKSFHLMNETANDHYTDIYVYDGAVATSLSALPFTVPF